MIYCVVMMLCVKVVLGFRGLNGEFGCIIFCSMMLCVDWQFMGVLIWDFGYFMQVFEGDLDYFWDFMKKVV